MVASRIKGITVTLIDKSLVELDPFGKAVYKDVHIPVDNVLVAPVSADDMVNQLNLTGRKAVYTLGIPKGDEHVWEGRDVEFFGERFRIFSAETQGIEAMIPLDWNKKVLVERYEQG